MLLTSRYICNYNMHIINTFQSMKPDLSSKQSERWSRQGRPQFIQCCQFWIVMLVRGRYVGQLLPETWAVDARHLQLFLQLLLARRVLACLSCSLRCTASCGDVSRAACSLLVAGIIIDRNYPCCCWSVVRDDGVAFGFSTSVRTKIRRCDCTRAGGFGMENRDGSAFQISLLRALAFMNCDGSKWAAHKWQFLLR